MKIVIPGFGHALLLLVARCAPIATKIFISGFAFAPLSQRSKDTWRKHRSLRNEEKATYPRGHAICWTKNVANCHQCDQIYEAKIALTFVQWCHTD